MQNGQLQLCLPSKTLDLGQAINKQKNTLNTFCTHGGRRKNKRDREGKETLRDHFVGLAQLSSVTKPPRLCTPAPKLQTKRKKSLSSPDEGYLCAHISKGKNLCLVPAAPCVSPTAGLSLGFLSGPGFQKGRWTSPS